jgi:hypothetical protein
MPASAALRDLYRKIERGEAEYGSIPSPTPDVPREVGVHFGPQLGWSPDRERPPTLLAWCSILSTREVFHVHLCGECGGDFGAIGPGVRVVCAACLRYGLDRLAAELRAAYPPPPPDRRHRPDIQVPERYRDRLRHREPVACRTGP